MTMAKEQIPYTTQFTDYQASEKGHRYLSMGKKRDRYVVS